MTARQRYGLTFLLLFLASDAPGQDSSWDRQHLPLQFATLGRGLAERLSREWQDIVRVGVERKYCVTAWEPRLTHGDHDTVFLATAASLIKPGISNDHRLLRSAECVDAQGKPQPTMHTHLHGDCAPSRADITYAIARRAPFDMVICGPGVANGFFWSTFRSNGGGDLCPPSPVAASPPPRGEE